MIPLCATREGQRGRSGPRSCHHQASQSRWQGRPGLPARGSLERRHPEPRERVVPQEKPEQMNDIRELKHTAVRNVEWTKPLTAPAIVFSLMVVAMCVVMMWR